MDELTRAISSEGVNIRTHYLGASLALTGCVTSTEALKEATRQHSRPSGAGLSGFIQPLTGQWYLPVDQGSSFGGLQGISAERAPRDAYFLIHDTEKQESQEPLRGDKTPQQQVWFGPVAARIRQLAKLQPGWDSYRAVAVGVRDVENALAFMLRVLRPDTPAPSVVALPRGGVQLEWHRGGMDIEVEFSGGRDQGLYYRDVVTDAEWEGPSDVGFEEFAIAERLAEASSRQGR